MAEPHAWPAGACLPMRVLVGLKVVPEIARDLVGLVRRLAAVLAPVAAADMHVTLVPPWNEASIDDAIRKLRTVAGNFRPFSLTFRRVTYMVPWRNDPDCCGLNVSPVPKSGHCGLRSSIFSGNATSGRFGRMRRWPASVEMDLRSRGNIQSISPSNTRSASSRLRSFDHLHPVEADIRSLLPLSWGRIRRSKTTSVERSENELAKAHICPRPTWLGHP